MYISSFRIDGFRHFSDVQVNDLAPGITIFFGPNETGKSTCLEFLRCMLVGYPAKKQAERLKPFSGGAAGGSIILRPGEALPQYPEIRLDRHPDAKAGFSLRTPTGKPLPDNLLESIFSGISRDVYSKVFGFSLGELENFETLSEKGVRDVLYAASFGPGINSPAAAIARLKNDMGQIFKPRSKAVLNAKLVELESLSGRIDDLREQSASYDGLRERLAEFEKELAELAAAKNEEEREIRQLERRLGVWNQWLQWRELKHRLDRLDVVSGSFPENAANRLARNQEARDLREGTIAGLRKKLDAVNLKIDSLRIDGKLLEELPALKRLAERKSGYRQALGNLAALEGERVRAEKDIAAGLGRLGAGWDCERIHATDRSLFAREDMEKAAAEMNSARLAQQTAMNALEKASKELDLTTRALNAAQSELAAHPEPPAILSPGEREEARANAARLRECQKQEPTRNQVFQKSRSALARALAPLQIPFNASEKTSQEDFAQIGHRLDTLLNGRARATELAEEIVSIKNEADAQLAQTAAAEQKAADLQKDLREREKESLANAGPTRQALETRTRALRELRSLSTAIAREQEHVNDLDERIQTEKKLLKQKNWLLLSVGGLFLACACAIFTLYWFAGMRTLQIASDIVIPLNLWAVYAALACGVLLCAAGLPSGSPDQKRRRQELEQLINRWETGSMQLGEMAAQTRQLCAAAEIESIDGEVLDKLEETLEEEKIRLARDQRIQEDVAELKRKEREALAEATKYNEEAQLKNHELQKARRGWHEFMQSLECGAVPLPEQAEAYFGRVENAKTACDNVENAQRELNGIWDDLYILEKSLTSIPAIAERLSLAAEAGQPMELLEALQQALDSCREADAIHEKRAHLLANEKNLRETLANQEFQYKEIFDHYEKCQQAYHAASGEWNATVGKLGLGESLSPETAREALNVMENILAAETRRQDAEASLARLQKEIEEVENPLRNMAEEFGQPPLSGKSADWLSMLDMFLKNAEEASRQALAKENLMASKEELENELASEEANLTKLEEQEKALFQQAGVANGDEFIRLAQIKEDRKHLEKDIANIECSLASVAGNQDFSAFLRSFEGAEVDEEERKLATAKSRLAELKEKELDRAKKYGQLKGEAEALEKNAEMALARQKATSLQEASEELASKWCMYAIAGELLAKARNLFEKEKQPEVIQLASNIFREITNGQWLGMGTSLENSTLTFLRREGGPAEAGDLSRGAQEQAYLSLRLAFIRNRSKTCPSLPVIMDEILVNFDQTRAERAARAIADLAADESGGPQQVFYFTCQTHMVEAIRSASPQSPIYTVGNGTITRN